MLVSVLRPPGFALAAAAPLASFFIAFLLAVFVLPPFFIAFASLFALALAFDPFVENALALNFMPLPFFAATTSSSSSSSSL